MAMVATRDTMLGGSIAKKPRPITIDQSVGGKLTTTTIPHGATFDQSLITGDPNPVRSVEYVNTSPTPVVKDGTVERKPRPIPITETPPPIIEKKPRTDPIPIVEAIVEVVQEEVAKVVPKKHNAEIKKATDSVHYDVFLLTDPKTTIHDIANQTGHNLRPGDRVILQDDNDNVSTSYICAKVFPAGDPIKYEAAGAAVASKSIKSNYLTYQGGRWWLVFSDMFYDTYLARYMRETPQYDSDGEPLYETDSNNNIVYDDDHHPIRKTRKEAHLRLGISRVLSQTSSSGRANWAEDEIKSSRKSYSLPEYIGGVETKPAEQVPATNKDGTPKVDKNGHPVYITIKYINRIRCTMNFVIVAKDCDVVPVPMVDVTDIVNNAIFCDDFNMRRSARRDRVGKTHYAGDVMFKQFTTYGYWFKRFGIYIKTNDGQIIYVTPTEDTYIVQVHDYYDYRNYNLVNLKWLGGRVISLEGNMPPDPYTVNPDYIVWKDRATAITVSDATKVAGAVPRVTATMSDSADPFVIPNKELLFDPELEPGGTFAGGTTYTIKVRGKQSLTTTAVIPAA